jgi:hypothetical protein
VGRAAGKRRCTYRRKHTYTVRLRVHPSVRVALLMMMEPKINNTLSRGHVAATTAMATAQACCRFFLKGQCGETDTAREFSTCISVGVPGFLVVRALVWNVCNVSARLNDHPQMVAGLGGSRVAGRHPILEYPPKCSCVGGWGGETQYLIFVEFPPPPSRFTRTGRLGRARGGGGKLNAM